MITRLGFAQAHFDTDFSIVTAHQVPIDPESGSFAGSTVGGVTGLAGTKYANVSARAERWTGRPEFDNSWDDIDELPFVEDEDGGPLRLAGFDPSQADGLDLRGFGSGRVRVMARGRHRYNYSSGTDRVDSLPPEEWLFQFFPTDGPPRPLDGGPRRLAGIAPFGGPPRSGWSSAVHAWEQTGWGSYLYASPGYRALNRALRVTEHAVTPSALAERAYRYVGRRPGERPEMPADPLAFSVDPPLDMNDPLASSTGLPTTTLGEAIEALRQLQLLLTSVRGGNDILVPNPDPGFVWDSISLTESETEHARRQLAMRISVGSQRTSRSRWGGFPKRGCAPRSPRWRSDGRRHHSRCVEHSGSSGSPAS